jgi:type IV pilus assembly protein PilO
MKLTRSGIMSVLNLHIAAVALLAVVNLVLLTQLLLAWNTLRNDRPEQLAMQQTELRTAQLQAMPLRNLPQRVKESQDGAAKFFDTRVAGADSALATELGEIAQKTNVRLGRVQYALAPALKDTSEVRIDASVSGDYTPIMRFINSLERDKMFFVINRLTLTGQQGGLVNLRLLVTTYLHGSDADRLQPAGGSNDQGLSNPAGQSGGE